MYALISYTSKILSKNKFVSNMKECQKKSTKSGCVFKNHILSKSVIYLLPKFCLNLSASKVMKCMFLAVTHTSTSIPIETV